MNKKTAFARNAQKLHEALGDSKFKRYSFSKDSLVEAMDSRGSDESITIKREVRLQDKLHFDYFFKYLSGLNAATIVVEKDYFSRSYFNDYANYYAKCFRKYPQRCVRVHFFNIPFDDLEFLSFIHNEKSLKLQDSYLGYIVVKPLALGYFGATLLKSKFENSQYAYKEYSVNLFGKKLAVKAMPFQEQDGVIGACASSALWSAFQITSGLFYTASPSPSEITLSAGLDLKNVNDYFPNTSLELSQVKTAIRANGLRAEMVEVTSERNFNSWTKGFIYSYMKMGIPVLLGIDFTDNDDQVLGSHLITVNGFKSSLNEKTPIPRKNQIYSSCTKITSLYVHDDQIGPNLELKFTKEQNKFDPKVLGYSVINGKQVKDMFIKFLLAPTPIDVKVSYKHILKEISTLDSCIQTELSFAVSWDIFLIPSNLYKESILKDISIEKTDNLRIVYECFPKYIWVARAKYGSILLFDVIYDPTDINIKLTPYKSTIYNKSLSDLIHSEKFSSHFEGLLNFFTKNDPEHVKMYDRAINNELDIYQKANKDVDSFKEYFNQQ